MWRCGSEGVETHRCAQKDKLAKEQIHLGKETRDA